MANKTMYNNKNIPFAISGNLYKYTRKPLVSQGEMRYNGRNSF